MQNSSYRTNKTEQSLCLTRRFQTNALIFITPTNEDPEDKGSIHCPDCGCTGAFAAGTKVSSIRCR